MPPLMVYLLTLFRFEAFSIWDHSGTFNSLYIARLIARQYGGTIYSRPNTQDHRKPLERWRDGKLVWRNPDYDSILAESQDYLNKLEAFWGLYKSFVDPDDRMP